MAFNFDELLIEHGADPKLLENDADEFYAHASKVPNKELYELMVLLRQDLINMMGLGLDHVPNSRFGKEVRRRCQMDLMWLAQYFCWMTNPASDNGARPIEENIFNEEFYGPFVRLFVAKDPSKPINRQSEVKTRLLLFPRGAAKSSFDHVDTVQWVLCFPQIRLLYLTAEKSLAEGFVGELKGHFYLKEDPTWMNIFWPTFCVEEGKSGAANEFTCPIYAAKKTGRKEPTVYASSVGKAKAGWRYEVIKADDAVSDTNSETSLLCGKVSNHLLLAEKLLALGGSYIDLIGTRYADEDHYGVLLSKNIGEIVKTEGRNWVFMENKSTNTNILIGRAIEIKPEVKDKLEREGRPISYIEAGEDGCTLLLPHLMSYSWCMGDLAKDEKSFEGQRNQNPQILGQLGFDRGMLARATGPHTMLPKIGPCSQVWDLASSQKKGRDYTVGTSVIWGEEDQIGPDGKKTGQKQTVGYVRKIKRGRFLPHQIAQEIVKLAQEEQPFVVAIENAQGATYLKDSILSAAYRTGDQRVINLCVSIDWFTPDQQKDAKKLRMGGLHPWISEGRFKFANYCMSENAPPHNTMEIVFNEFEKCLFDHHHDDIPDNLGHQLRYAPRATQVIVENNIDMMSRIDRQGWNDVYNPDWQGRGIAYYPDENGNLVPWDEPMNQVIDDFLPAPEVDHETPHGMQNILGAGMFG